MSEYTVKLVFTTIIGWTAARSGDEVSLNPILLNPKEGTFQDTGVKISDYLGTIQAMPGQKQVKLVLCRDGKPVLWGITNRIHEPVEQVIGIETETEHDNWEKFRAEADAEPARYFSCYFSPLNGGDHE